MSLKTECAIAQNRSRMKKYGNLLYLKDQQEFQIELFNAESEEILAKIWINEEPLSKDIGILLKPGQRIFLERYLDNNRKFIFSSYDVENISGMQNTIKHNGKIRVEFYKKNKLDNFTSKNEDSILLETFKKMADELIKKNHNHHHHYYPYQPYKPFAPSPFEPQIWYSTNTNVINNQILTDGISNSNTTTIIPSDNITFTNSVGTYYVNTINNNIETGRIEKGEISNQVFDEEINTSEWCKVAFHKEIFQLLPFSRKPADIKPREYCTNCGSKIYKDWKFCACCGTKM